MIIKPFDKGLHDRYDVAGRDAVKRYLAVARGKRGVDNPDPMGVDLFVMFGDHLEAYCEVEVRPNWRGDRFPFDTVHVPERKTKLLRNDLQTWFVSVNSDQTYLLVCPAQTVLDAPLREVSNRLVIHSERFYDVPIAQMRLRKVPSHLEFQQICPRTAK